VDVGDGFWLQWVGYVLRDKVMVDYEYGGIWVWFGLMNDFCFNGSGYGCGYRFGLKLLKLTDLVKNLL